MKLLDSLMDGLYLRPRPLPDGLTAVLEPMFHEGRDGSGLALTGYPVFLGTETDDAGYRFARFRIGFGRDAHLTVRTADPKWFAVLAEEAVKGHDALNPVPAAMGDPS